MAAVAGARPASRLCRYAARVPSSRGRPASQASKPAAGGGVRGAGRRGGGPSITAGRSPGAAAGRGYSFIGSGCGRVLGVPAHVSQAGSSRSTPSG